MKTSPNKLTLLYTATLLTMVVVGHEISIYFSNALFNYTFVKEVVFVVFSGLVLRYFLYRSEKNHESVFEKLKVTNDEIKESNERYDIVAKATSDTIWDWKIEEDNILWNKGIEGVFGYKMGEVENTSKWWFDRIHPEDSLKMSVKLYAFLEQKTEKWQDEYRFQCADGSYRYVFDRGFLVKDSSGKATRMIGTIQDITKQKEEEQRLRLQETVITQTKDAVMITDIDTSESVIPNIIFINSAFTDMTGYPTEEIIGKSLEVLFGKKSNILEFDKLKTAIQEYKECFVETIAYKKSGEEFWINFSMIPVTNKDGEHSHWISIQRDVTEEKEKEKEREQLIKELTQNNKDLKQFSYITSHNLRAPLSNLTGLLNMMDDIVVEDDELKELINGFSVSTHQLNETVNDLAKVIVIKDNTSVEKEKVSVQEVFENVFNQLGYLISTNKPILKIDLDGVQILDVNKSYLESVFLNLLTNAMKFKDQERPLKIGISSEVENDNIILTFKDNGIGIDLERNRDKIFGLYQRFHNYPDSKGLGLYLVKSQVESMGGTISVDSVVGKGTVFTIVFKEN